MLNAPFFRMLRLVAPLKKQVFLSSFIGLVLAILAPVRPALIQYAVDNYIANHLLDMLILASAILLALVLLDGVLRFYFTYMSCRIGQYSIQRLRERVFKKILGLRIRQIDKTPIGVLCTRTIDDTQRINEVFSDGILPVIIDIISVFAVLGYMFYLSPLGAFVALSPFPIMIIATYFFKRSVSVSFHHVRNAVAAINTFINEQLSGIHIIKAFVAEEDRLERFNEHNEEHKRQNVKAVFAYAVFFPVVEIISALSIGLLIWWSAEGTASNPGEIMSFILCINTIFRPLRFIADKFNGIQMGIHAAKRVFSLLDNDDITPSGNFIPRSKHIRGDIEFDSVHFSYKKGAPVLNELSFSIEAGKKLAIVGRTGSGKTTTIALINRLYEHEKGKIFLDKTAIETYDIAFLRQQVGYVSQDVFLFEGSIYSNIAFANTSISVEEAETICKTLQIHEIIQSLPNQYEFIVKEGGSNLSQGQRQLLSIARVFAQNPSVVVLDEATASIDPRMEAVVEHATEHVLKGKTAIIIAHRYNSIVRADKILVLEEGRLKEEGTHEELMISSAYYKKIFLQQSALTYVAI